MIRKVIIGAPTFTTLSVPNTGRLLLAANPRRMVATIINPSATNLWIHFGSQGIVGQGIFIGANGFSYEIDINNLYRGAIYGIHSAVLPININTYEGV